ncbi:MAG: NUDIX hydrolase, partial [Actinomycetota bacterium]
MPLIRAAGGVVVRGDSADDLELAVVHRPRYDDWSLPKGKHDEGESSPQCALREVEEETGYRCRIVGSGGTTRYRARGEPKEVEYFLMRPVRSYGFLPDDEVDEMRWVASEEALGMLTYDFDRDLVASTATRSVARRTHLHLVRHATAGNRSEWEGPDPERPLDTKGLSQSKALADQLGDIGVSRIVTSPYLRCVQTVAPLGERAGLVVETSEDLAEGAGHAGVARLLEDMAGSTVVACSHGDVIPALLDRLQMLGTRVLDPPAWKKGSTWVIAHDGTSFTEAAYFPPPPV